MPRPLTALLATLMLATPLWCAEEPPPVQGTRLHFERTLAVERTPAGKVFAETRRFTAGEELREVLRSEYRIPAEQIPAFLEAFKAVNPGVDPDRLDPTRIVRVPFKIEESFSPRPSPGGSPAYTVKAGDNLWKILTRQYGVERSQVRPAIAALRAANPSLTDPDRLYVGQRLSIPSSLTTAPVNASEPIDSAQQQSVLDLLERLGCRVTLRGEIFVPVARGRTVRLDARDFPVIAGPEGSTVVLDPGSRISPALARSVEELWNYKILRGADPDAEGLLSRLLPHLRFYEVTPGSRSIGVGQDVELLALARWTVVPRAQDLWEGQIHLIFSPGSVISQDLAGLASRRGFRLHVLGSALETDIPEPGLSAVPGIAMGDPASGAGELLALLGVAHRVRPQVECQLGGGVSYAVRPELTFRHEGIDYAVPPAAPERAADLLTRSGYFTLGWPEAAARLNILGDLLALLGVPHARTTVESPPDQALRLRLRGIVLEDWTLARLVYPNRAEPTSRLFLTEAQLSGDAARALMRQGLLPWVVIRR